MFNSVSQLKSTPSFVRVASLENDVLHFPSFQHMTTNLFLFMYSALFIALAGL